MVTYSISKYTPRLLYSDRLPGFYGIECHILLNSSNVKHLLVCNNIKTVTNIIFK